MRRPAHRRGATLLEALVAGAVFAAGLLGVAGLHGAIQSQLRVVREEAQAMRSARAELEAMRRTEAAQVAPGETRSGRATLPPRPGDAVPAPFAVDWTTHGDDVATTLVWLRAAVAAANPAPAARPARLDTAVHRVPAALSGALLVARRPPLPGLPGARPTTLPATARDLGNGRSAWRPVAASPLAFVTDHASGRIVARCGDMNDAATCTPVDALPLSGWIRVSLATPPDPARAGDPALPAGVTLALTRGTLIEPGCLADVQAGALAYHCAIAPEGGAWSGRSDVAPAGWVVGSAPGEYRVCRYVSDAGGEPRRDAAAGNAAHPARYELVDRPLMQQNFLVIRGEQPCPAAPPSPDRPAGLVTAAHQP